MMQRILIVIIGYLLGGFQTAVIISRIKGIDIRTQGSGNAGATNTLRVLGPKFAAIVFVSDMLKAVLAILIANWFFKDSSLSYVIISIYAGLGAIAGHNWPLYFGFRGGKGIAVSIATLMMIDYRIGLTAAIMFIGTVFLTKIVSLGSILLTITGPVILTVLYRNAEYFSEAVILMLVIPIVGIYQHRENISRLFKGTESKLGQKSKEQ